MDVTRKVDATPEQVWAALEDGWLYPSWVVGASRMRAVGEDWPAQGQRLHHSAGLWPMVTNDETVSIESEPPRHLRLQAKGWPAGEATIDLRIEPRARGCVVRSQEDVTKGPALVVPEPLRQVVLASRNKETLRRLAYIAEGRTTPTSGDGPHAGTRESRQESHTHEA